MSQDLAQPIAITMVEDAAALWERRIEWNALVERSATNTVFQTLEWHSSWWSALRADARLLVLLAETAGELVGVAPLMLSEQRVFGRERRVIEFIGADATDYADFIVEPTGRKAVVTRMLEWLADHGDRWDVLRLLNIAESSALPELLPEVFGRRGYALDVRPLSECPTRIFGDRAADQKLPRKKKIREHYNQLRRQGEVQFKLYGSATEMEGALDAFFRQHADRWAGTRTPSLFLDARQRDFYRELVRRLAPQGWVLFSAVILNGAPISFHFGFQYSGRIYWIKPAFDPAYARFAPGMLQIKYLLEYAMAHDAREMDFTVGEESYKYRFANHKRTNYVARVHRRRMFYGVDRLLAGARTAAARAPALRHFARRFVKPLLGGTP
jgi:CelD/BcsL family acetyltransferase involved in cellulose biosynthesis